MAGFFSSSLPIGDYHSMKTRHWMTASTVALFFTAAFAASAPGQQAERKSVAVQHPNLLLNQTEIERLKHKVQEDPWARRLLDRVKAKPVAAAIGNCSALSRRGSKKLPILRSSRFATKAFQ
jgi:hypothetical protein